LAQAGRAPEQQYVGTITIQGVPELLCPRVTKPDRWFLVLSEEEAAKAPVSHKALTMAGPNHPPQSNGHAPERNRIYNSAGPSLIVA